MRKILEKLPIALMAVLLSSTAFSLIETNEECVEPDHFVSYPLDSSTSFASLDAIALHDRFIGGGGDPDDFAQFELVDAVRLLNPATKYHQGNIYEPEHPNTHYVAILLEDVEDGVTVNDTEVTVLNQFGEYTFNIADDDPDTNLVLDDDGDPINHLLVPSVKGTCSKRNGSSDEDGCFPNGDFYLCYDIIAEEGCSVDARFSDQFIENRRVENLLPNRLCVPVDVSTDVQDGDDDGLIRTKAVIRADKSETNHLLCYDANDKRVQARSVKLLNFFGQQSGLVRLTDEICVPSTLVAQDSQPSFVTADSCCEIHEDPGCNDADCITAICDIDDYCCLDGFDDLCVQEAEVLCSNICSNTSNCCQIQETASCSNALCSDRVCAINPDCCNIAWDAACVTQASISCGNLCQNS